MPARIALGCALVVATTCGCDERVSAPAGDASTSAGGAGAGGVGGGAGSGGAPGIGPLVWEPCSLFDGDGRGPPAECATAKVPVRWDAPEGATIDSFVKRVRASAPRRGQLWLLSGGPGLGGDI